MRMEPRPTNPKLHPTSSIQASFQTSEIQDASRLELAAALPETPTPGSKKKNRGQPLYPYASVSASIGFFPLHRFAVFWQLWLESRDFSVQV